MADALPVLAGLAVLGGVLAWLAVARRYALLALLWLLLPMAWRLVSSAYIDFAGPVFSEQTGQFVGPGRATGLLAFDYAVALAAFALLLPARFELGIAQGRWSEWIGANWRAAGNVSFALVSAFLVLLYLDLLRTGSIPLFSGIERYDYTRDHAGVLHGLLFRFGDVLAMYLGALAVLPAVFGRPIDRRYLLLLLAILAYAFLTGNRYSAFFKFCTLFAIPCAVLAGSGQRLPRSAWAAAAFFAAVAGGLVAYAVLNSYFGVRFEDAEDPLANLQQRVLIQQAEMWWLTYDRVIDAGIWDLSAAWQFLFTSPVDPGRNTSIQYLMVLAIGEEALPFLAHGHQYAGGFPEIFHELAGGFGGAFLLALFCVLPALVLRALLQGVAHARPLTVLFAALLLYPLLISFWGGMLNYVLGWGFWAKAAGLLAALVVEGGGLRNALPLFKMKWATGRSHG